MDGSPVASAVARNATAAAVVALVVALSVPATVAATTAQTDETHSDTAGVVVQNAQVETLQVDNATVDNVTIRVLQINELTVQNQTTNEQVNETLGGEGDQRTMLRNVTFDTLTLADGSAEGVDTSQVGGPGAGPDRQMQADGQLQVGNVSDVTIARMSVDRLQIEQLDVEETGGGGVFQGISDWLGGVLGGGDGQQAQENETPEAGGEQQPGAAADGQLMVGNVDVSELTVENMSVGTLERTEVPADEQTPAETPTATPGTPTGTPGTPTETPAGGEQTPAVDTPTENQSQAQTGQTVIGRITVESATIGTIDVDTLHVEVPENQTETETPTETTPTPGGAKTPAPDGTVTPLNE